VRAGIRLADAGRAASAGASCHVAAESGSSRGRDFSLPPGYPRGAPAGGGGGVGSGGEGMGAVRGAACAPRARVSAANARTQRDARARRRPVLVRSMLTGGRRRERRGGSAGYGSPQDIGSPDTIVAQTFPSIPLSSQKTFARFSATWWNLTQRLPSFASGSPRARAPQRFHEIGVRDPARIGTPLLHAAASPRPASKALSAYVYVSFHSRGLCSRGSIFCAPVAARAIPSRSFSRRSSRREAIAHAPRRGRLASPSLAHLLQLTQSAARRREWFRNRSRRSAASSFRRSSRSSTPQGWGCRRRRTATARPPRRRRRKRKQRQ
jgi:hypothetical protein